MKNLKIQTEDIPKLVDTLNIPSLHMKQGFISLTIKVAYKKRKSILTIGYKDKEEREMQVNMSKLLPFSLLINT